MAVDDNNIALATTRKTVKHINSQAKHEQVYSYSELSVRYKWKRC